MDIGCNKGYDFMLQYAFWGGVGRSKLESDFQQHATNLRHAPGVCNADDPAAEMRFVSAEKQRDVYGWCFEPTLSTMNAVNSSLASLGYLPPHVHTIRAAVSSSSGSILFPNPPLGVESAGLGTAKFPLVRVSCRRHWWSPSCGWRAPCLMRPTSPPACTLSTDGHHDGRRFSQCPQNRSH